MVNKQFVVFWGAPRPGSPQWCSSSLTHLSFWQMLQKLLQVHPILTTTQPQMFGKHQNQGTPQGWQENWFMTLRNESPMNWKLPQSLNHLNLKSKPFQTHQRPKNPKTLRIREGYSTDFPQKWWNLGPIAQRCLAERAALGSFGSGRATRGRP